VGRLSSQVKQRHEATSPGMPETQEEHLGA
jgi:hypothetical protein